jgi:hypothetical protein
MAETIDYNTDLEQLLKTHAEECESLSILHRNSYEKYNGRSNYINIPVIILSSAIGFATGIDIGYANMNIILGVSSIFVGIIKSIDTYFHLGKRAESHRLCSLQFQQINKKIQIELALVRSQRVDAKDMMNIIKTDIKNLFDIAPLIDQDVIESFQKKYGRMPTYYAAQGYDTALAIAAALKETGGKVDDVNAFSAAMRKANFQSVRGSFRFGPNQHPVHDWYSLRVERGADGNLGIVTKGKVLESHSDIYAKDCKL